MTISCGLNELNVSEPGTPSVELAALDVVWFQVAGTICNLRCHHCFISCAPENDKFAFLSPGTCRRYLEESARHGVKEYYFTGGEPFANPQLCDILDLTLTEYGPATVLTNATLLRDFTLDRLRTISEASLYSLEIRVSLDGYTKEMNDPIRGEGTFALAMDGTKRLVERGFLPIITIARTWDGNDEEVLAGFVDALRQTGYDRPRLKILPLLKLGAEVDRHEGYSDAEQVTADMMTEYDQGQLLCSSARVVTNQGVWVCPILLDSPEARMGDTLAETMRDYPLRHKACYTCWRYGAICSNAAGSATMTTDA